MWRYRKVYPIVVLFLWFLNALQTEAAYEDIPNISMSADGNAFTTHAGDTNGVWYEKGTEVYTGVEGGVKEPNDGEHVYDKEMTGEVAVEKWVVSWEEARCIHKIYPSGNMVYGELFNKKYCQTGYYSGWIAYCADCKEPIIHNYIYMSEDTARKFTHMDLSIDYFYKCAHCNNLEMSVPFEKHVCEDISANRYFVRYHANLGTGYMEKSVHMVGNSTIYEGREVTPQRTLNLNTYTRKGYVFDGWNTKQDGSGEHFADGAEIWNLSMEQNANVILYAQWRKCESVLEVDPAGGSYAGKTEITQIAGKYASVYHINLSELKMPVGYTIHFDSNGGIPVADIVGGKEFVEWSCETPFHGSLTENTYTFLGPNGGIDRITAVYADVSIILPVAQKEGFSFGGWYADAECTQRVGGSGDKFMPTKETTLYADWVELLLNAEDNYTANQGKGAVNLLWNQKDDWDKVYQVYQRTDDTDWIQIDETQEKHQEFQVKRSISFSGETGYYTVPYTGFYTLILTGAQGGNYGSYLGGKGGQVQAVIYLKKGERLTYVIGGQSGYSGGGKGNMYANGGGYSIITSDRQGTLLMAGGGGGATERGNGGAGGSAAQVITTSQGQNGEAGGGGGYQGGVAGEVEIHHHTDTCTHKHIGSPDCYGGCYTKKVPCGCTDITKTKTGQAFYYGNIADDGSWKFCERCASDDCAGHLDIYYKYTCKRCGASSSVKFTECTKITAYAPECGFSEGYNCEMEEGEILYVEPAFGGSNYANAEACIDYTFESGVQSGNGELYIVSKQIGFMEENCLADVTATDMAKPDVITEAGIMKTAIAEDKVRIAFTRPEDNGTAYYHMVESYAKETNTKLCTSNQTKNTLVSGIVGYYYIVDNYEKSIVGEKHTYYAEKGESPFLVVKVGEGDQYLHVAAVDKAGNIGDTCHILISEQDIIYWPLLTEKLQIEMENSVYPAASEDTYYVKADGSTPFSVMLDGLLCGTARKEYQINQACFQVSNLSVLSQAGQMLVIVPNRETIVAGTFTYPMGQLQKKLDGILGLQDAAYTIAKRTNMCKSLRTMQKFIIPQSYDSQQLRITPRVAAIGEAETVWSQEENDLLHSIYIIADGKGPDVAGVEKLDTLKNLELSERERLEIDISASDSGSGLAKFYVEIRNVENGIIRRYQDDSLTGRISVEISEEDQVFCGEFIIEIYAEDYVGNETSIQDSVLIVGLNAYVERVLEPHTPVFKRGESGLLHIETIGYVERVEVTFPEVFEKQDASLSRVFVYEKPEYIQTEEIPFVVPFTAQDGEMTILVKAYKAGTDLEKEPKLLTITVKGSILDELRTRLR